MYSGYEYNKRKILFDGYVDKIYEKRFKTADKILNAFYKKMLKTLYGRFG